jgi:hypothetical protein
VGPDGPRSSCKVSIIVLQLQAEVEEKDES